MRSFVKQNSKGKPHGRRERDSGFQSYTSCILLSPPAPFPFVGVLADFSSYSLGGNSASNPSLSSLRTEREGFEPSEPLQVQRFSRPPDSTALASLQIKRLQKSFNKHNQCRALPLYLQLEKENRPNGRLNVTSRTAPLFLLRTVYNHKPNNNHPKQRL